jgi:hypothetical protein
MKLICDQLGACQSRTPPCTGCLPRPAFAPGVIEHHKRRYMRSLTRWFGRALVLLLLAAVALQIWTH